MQYLCFNFCYNINIAHKYNYINTHNLTYIHNLTYMNPENIAPLFKVFAYKTILLFLSAAFIGIQKGKHNIRFS